MSTDILINIICPITMITIRIYELIAGIIPKIVHNLWLYIHNIKYNVIISNGIMMKQN